MKKMGIMYVVHDDTALQQRAVHRRRREKDANIDPIITFLSSCIAAVRGVTFFSLRRRRYLWIFLAYDRKV